MKRITPEWMSNQHIAHRGLHDSDIFENSLPAFEKAVEHNYAIELDVHITTDNEIVVFHDDELSRLSNGKGLVREHNLQQLQSLKLNDGKSVIPTLRQVLETVNGKVPLLIEIKSHPDIGILENALVKILDSYQGKFAVQSFNPFVVKWFTDNKPNYTRGQLSSYDMSDANVSKFQQFLLKNCLLNIITKPDFISYDVETADDCPRLIRKFNRQKKVVILWTVRKPEQLNNHKFKYDNFIFENFLLKNNN